MSKNYGLFFIGPDGTKFFYRSYLTEDNVIYAIEKDEEFKKLPKKKIIVIKLGEEDKEDENNN